MHTETLGNIPTDNSTQSSVYNMVHWDSLIRFQATDGQEYWASIALEETPAAGLTVQGFPSIEALESDATSTSVTVEKVCTKA